MARRLAEEVVRAPTAGIDTASADAAVPAGRSRTNTNFLPGRNGKLTLRGPVVWYGDLTGIVTLASTANSAIKSIGWTFGIANDDDLILVGNADTGSAAVAVFLNPAGPFPASVSAAFALPAALANPNYWATASVQRPTDGSYVRLGSYTYGLASSSGGGASGLARWNGGFNAAAFTEITNGPTGGRSIATWLDRVFVLGGSVPGTPGTYYGNRLFWTDPSWDGTDTLAKWQDDVTGLVNQIILDDVGDEPLALAVHNHSLLILRRRSITAVVGTSPANFTVRTVAHVGCVAAASVVVHDTGVYFLSDHGYMVYDGSAPTNVSEHVDNSAFASLRDDINGRSNTSATLIDSDHLAISGPNFTAIMHITTRSWMALALDGISATNPGLMGQSPNYPFVVTNVAGKQRICLLDEVAYPEIAVATGKPFSDFGSVAYGGTVRSRIIQLASPNAKAQLQRLLTNTKPLGTTGFTVTIEKLDGTVIKTLAIPSSANDWVQEDVMDLDGIEADFVRVKWSLTSATGPVEIQDAKIEYQPAQERT